MVTRSNELAGPWRAVQFEPGSGLGASEIAGRDDAAWVDATVPGVIQYDLVRNDLLRNPYASSQTAHAAHWVSAADWVYTTSFDLDPQSDADRWGLEFEGVDTYADVWLNGKQLGNTANAYRKYRFEVAVSDLRPTGNELVVHVKGHGSMIVDKVAEARKRLGHVDEVEGKLGKSLIRRYQRSFFSGSSSLLNIGTGVLGIGVHRPVRLIPLPAVEITDVFVSTVSLAAAFATLEGRVTVDTRGAAGPYDLTLTLTDPDGTDTVVASASTPVTGASEPTELRLTLDVAEPRAWWPRGYGDATLYPLTVTISRDGVVVDTVSQAVGIRTIELLEEKPSGRPTFEFIVNGVPIHVRGTNYIPIDYLKVHGDDAAYERVFALFENGNNNLVRMWGGGAIESESFYDECDRRGIMVWQDFYLHSNTYPDYDEEFVAEFRQESRELIVQMRRHASLVMLCGGNEQREGWDEWGWKDLIDQFYGEKLITQTIPELVDELQPGVPYVDNSPHGGLWSQSPVRGEGHIWGNFFNSTKDPLFVTETCWGQESYSRPETLKEVMDLDVDEFTGLGWPEKWAERTGRAMLIRFPFTGYHHTGGLREYIRGLEIEQAMADHFSLYNFRLRSGSNRGIVYWSFNKGGPLFQFGAVDYRLRPLMSHYMVARLYRDVVVGAYRDIDDVRVVVSNLSTSPIEAELELVHVNVEGEVIKRWTATKSIAADTNARVLDLDEYYRDGVVDRNREAIFARVTVDGVAVSDDLLMLCPMAELETPKSAISTKVRKVEEGVWELDMTTDGFSKLVQVENADGLILSDNYFPLVAGFPRTITVRALERAGDANIVLSVSSIDSEAADDVVLP